MGNQPPTSTHKVYVAKVKKAYFLCPDHMPVVMGAATAAAPTSTTHKVYCFYLSYSVPFDPAPLARKTVQQYKGEASRVEKISQLSSRDVEILDAIVEEEDDAASSLSSLSKVTWV